MRGFRILRDEAVTLIESEAQLGMRSNRLKVGRRWAMVLGNDSIASKSRDLRDSWSVRFLQGRVVEGEQACERRVMQDIQRNQ